MGMINEDVFSCKKCDSSVVYEPYNEIFVECSNCGAKHSITQRETIIELIEDGMFVVDIYLNDSNIIKEAVIFKNKEANGAIQSREELVEHLNNCIENNRTFLFSTRHVSGNIIAKAIDIYDIKYINRNI